MNVVYTQHYTQRTIFYIFDPLILTPFWQQSFPLASLHDSRFLNYRIYVTGSYKNLRTSGEAIVV